MKMHNKEKYDICIYTHKCDKYHKYHNRQQKRNIHLCELLDKLTQVV